jgi:hypothetical protein
MMIWVPVKARIFKDVEAAKGGGRAKETLKEQRLLERQK